MNRVTTIILNKIAEDDRDFRDGMLTLGTAGAGGIGAHHYARIQLAELRKQKLDIAAKARKRIFFKKMRAIKSADKIKEIQSVERKMRALGSKGALAAGALGLAGVSMLGKSIYDKNRRRRQYV